MRECPTRELCNLVVHRSCDCLQSCMLCSRRSVGEAGRRPDDDAAYSGRAQGAAQGHGRWQTQALNRRCKITACDKEVANCKSMFCMPVQQQ